MISYLKKTITKLGTQYKKNIKVNKTSYLIKNLNFNSI